MYVRASICILVASIAPFAFAENPVEQLLLATYKLDNESSTATGTVICVDSDAANRQCVVLTADHVLSKMRGDGCTLVSRTAVAAGFQREEIRIPIRSEGRMLWKKHPHFDLAVLPLPKSVTINSLPLTSLATAAQMTDVHPGDNVRIAVFPERSEANGAGFPLLRHGSLASFPLIPVHPHPRFLIDTTSWSGDSGGPVMHHSLRSAEDGPLIIGVVTGMRSITDTTKESRFVERRTHYPLGITEALHATFAREIIDQL
ncbi:MAG: trypsin-like peptidase domain-containing protein [Rubripirellula sp.]|jgi:hypothetical protein|nr:trypsin-like peptidase domain-containing protein [Rubripirellula sp.]